MQNVLQGDFLSANSVRATGNVIGETENSKSANLYSSHTQNTLPPQGHHYYGQYYIHPFANGYYHLQPPHEIHQTHPFYPNYSNSYAYHPHFSYGATPLLPFGHAVHQAAHFNGQISPDIGKKPDKPLIDDSDSDEVDGPIVETGHDCNRRAFSPAIKQFLMRWLHRYKDNPYPSARLKARLAEKTGLQINQVEDFLVNGINLF